MRFDGKVGIITGGAAGIGRETVLGFARHGGTAVIADYDDAKAQALAGEIVASGGSAKAVHLDLRQPDEMCAAIRRVEEEFGRIDFLHNNAFSAPPGYTFARTEDTNVDHWRDMVEVIINATFLATRTVLPGMRQRGSGSIVNTASIAGAGGGPGSGAYGTAKAAVINFTRIVALEYASSGVRCNVVLPGVIHTTLSEKVMGEAWREKVKQSIPMRRDGAAQEVANVVLFLASDLASFVTGASYVVDGGQSAKSGLLAAIGD